MPDKMTISIKVDNANQTYSRFVIDEKGQVSFRNDATNLANILFEDPSPFCQGSNPEPLSFDIGSGQTSTHKVCKDFGDREFKYTATVVGALPEDPILFVERAGGGGGSSTNPIIWVEMVPSLLVGMLLGAFAGYWLAKRRGMRAK